MNPGSFFGLILFLLFSPSTSFVNTSPQPFRTPGTLRQGQYALLWHLLPRRMSITSIFSVPPPRRNSITTIQGLDDAFSSIVASHEETAKQLSTSQIRNIMKTIDVRGSTSASPSNLRKHGVKDLIYHRKNCNKKDDGHKLTLAIEGGGMRGCVSAGMVTAIHHLGLENSFDNVYGSSAGSLIGAYFITRQLPLEGPEVYYDKLTNPVAGKSFIDTNRILRAVGIGLLNPMLVKDVLFRKLGKPVLDLGYLLTRVAMNEQPLDFSKFKERQQDQPLHIVASALEKNEAITFCNDKKDFSTMQELTDCMWASMLLPGIAGPIKEIHGEPCIDALLFEPLPYVSAIKDGNSHVLILRTRADGKDVSGVPSYISSMIAKRFFVRKHKFKKIYSRMKHQLHKREYARACIETNTLNDERREFYDMEGGPQVMTIAMREGQKDVDRLERDRKEIFEGVRRGFEAAFDALKEDGDERNGQDEAKIVFPDAILDYDPKKFKGWADYNAKK